MLMHTCISKFSCNHSVLLQNGYSTSIPMKEGSLKEDGHMNPNESLDEYLQRIEQFVNVDFPEQYTGKNPVASYRFMYK